MLMDRLNSRRINYIDFLKFIGLTGIFAAHVGSPKWFMMLRSFDVPFMVILSSILAHKSYDRHNADCCFSMGYTIYRLKRLIFPVWIFLIIYFPLEFLICGSMHHVKYYIASFCLTRYGIGYVWIILIYVYSALLIPLFSRVQDSRKGLICIIVLYAIYELSYHFQIGIQNKIVDTTFYYIVPYGVVTYIGFNYLVMSSKCKMAVTTMSVAVFILLAVIYWHLTGEPQLVQIAKYPPRLYYLSYGIAWSLALLHFSEKHSLKIYENKIVRFVSEHSMWIYLWHILVLMIYKELCLPEIWFVKLLIVYMASSGIVVIVNVCLDVIEAKYPSVTFLKYLRG